MLLTTHCSRSWRVSSPPARPGPGSWVRATVAQLLQLRRGAAGQLVVVVRRADWAPHDALLATRGQRVTISAEMLRQGRGAGHWAGGRRPLVPSSASVHPPSPVARPSQLVSELQCSADPQVTLPAPGDGDGDPGEGCVPGKQLQRGAVLETLCLERSCSRLGAPCAPHPGARLRAQVTV